ncbi:hypothetical protein EDC04DRAFT_2600403 [Pisolithus marmoratus]|nr:hypothetical protein EDC04DRAFT_2600403 [Pisolithus marmoratus]
MTYNFDGGDCTYLRAWVGADEGSRQGTAEFGGGCYSPSAAEKILDDIDRSCRPIHWAATSPSRPTLQTVDGDDSKGLMKVYIAAIEGYVPAEVILTFSAFLEFCYLQDCEGDAEEFTASFEEDPGDTDDSPITSACEEYEGLSN